MILIYTVMVFIDIVFISTSSRLKEESHSQKASYEVITVKLKLRMSRVRELSKKNLEIESR